MRIAIHNPFAGQQVAEAELSRRILLAAVNLGWEAIEVSTTIEIVQCHPAFVIALHSNGPKVSGYPTYGCMFSPPSFFEGNEQQIRNTLSYDGYLASSQVLDRWLHHLLYTTSKTCFVAPFYASCPKNHFQPPDLIDPHLVYLGSNWDGARFQDLFLGLDHDDMEIYGDAEGWKYLRHSYRGALPFDGVSVLKTLNQAGVGLCLHREEHRQAELPSMRIFEIVASGAVAICGEHPFIRSAFGDSVLYLDPDLPVAEQIHQILTHLNWIRSHPQMASEMAAQAHQIFVEHYALEPLLLEIQKHHEALLNRKGFIYSISSDSAQVQVMVRMGDRSSGELATTLDSLANQSYRNIAALVVTEDIVTEDMSIEPLLSDAISMQTIASPPSKFRSTSLWTGLQAIAAPYFAIVNAGDRLHLNHVATLVMLLENPAIDVAYSGACTSGSGDSDSDSLPYFQPFDLDRLLCFDDGIALSSAIARSTLLDAILQQDPLLQDFEELCLLLHLSQRGRFCFSYEVTCEVLRLPTPDLFLQSQNWGSEISRLKFIFWRQEFAPGKSLQSAHQARLQTVQLQKVRQELQQDQRRLRREVEQLQATAQTAQATIAAMETSKFWQFRQAWFWVKRSIGIPTNH